MKYFYLILILFSLSSFAQTDSEIVDILINESRASYPGNCACPDDRALNGSRCGKRSAYIRKGGYGPLCYSQDVSESMIQRWRSARGVKKPVQVSAAKKSAAHTLQQGSYFGIYNRSDWKHWVDSDGDCQDTRAEVLIAQSLGRVSYNNNRRCSVKSGAWLDPYSGQSWALASDLDIDHIVPLSWANGHGGSAWTKARKRKFANDFTNLVAVENRINRAKGDKGPDEWMPPRHEYRCEYLKRFDGVVISYKLMYAPSEKRVIDRMKKACG
jgi:hypothetical protein